MAVHPICVVRVHAPDSSEQHAPCGQGLGEHVEAKPRLKVPHGHPLPADSVQAPVVVSQQAPLHGPSSQTPPLMKMLGDVQADATLIVHDWSDGRQQAPPQGFVGVHVLPSDWNVPPHAPGAVMPQLPSGAQHAPVVGA
jgi:hypothetical protein